MAKEPLMDKLQRYVGEPINAGWGLFMDKWDQYARPTLNRAGEEVDKGVKIAEQGAQKVALGTLDKLGDGADGIRRLTRRPRELVKASVPALVMGLLIIDKPIPAVILAGLQQVTHLGGGIAKSIRTRNGWHAGFAFGEAVATFGALGVSPEVAALTGATLSEVSTMQEHVADVKEFNLVPATPRPKRSANRR